MSDLRGWGYVLHSGTHYCLDAPLPWAAQTLDHRGVGYGLHTAVRVAGRGRRVSRGGKTVEVARSEARLYLDKGIELCGLAEIASAGSRHDAAVLNAVHAVISAADAVCIGLAGRRSADPDHQRAIDLLVEDALGGARGGSIPTARMRRILAKRNIIEYTSRRARPSEAEQAVRDARRVVEWAGPVLAHTGT